MRDAIIVGGGIIGTTVAVALQRMGDNVLLLDDRRAMSGTRPSGGHLKPSWYANMHKSEAAGALELLCQLWNARSELFKLLPAGVETEVWRVDTDMVVATSNKLRTRATVSGIDPSLNMPKVTYQTATGTTTEYCKQLLIATGAWSNELVSGSVDQCKAGVSFRVEGTLDDPFIKPWAPYKQVVAHQQGDNEIWVGDGTAIIQPNWSDVRVQQCKERCLSVLPAGELIRTVQGLRPYAKKLDPTHPCYFRQLGPHAWVATGAGKSGTIAAGWVAGRICDAIGC